MPQNNVDLYILARQLDWQLQLDDYSDEQAKTIFQILEQSKRLLSRKLQKVDSSGWSLARTKTLLDQIQGLLQDVRLKIADGIANATATAGAASYDVYSDILSFGGAAKNVTPVAMTAETLKSIIVTTPIGGETIAGWVNQTFSSQLRDRIRREVAAGLIDGSSYPQIVNRLKTGWTGAKHELDTLVKTYVSSINSQAMQDLFEANKDIVKQVQWRAALSNRTCLRCSGLDGHTYPLQNHPPLPLHARCRCVLTPRIESIQSLGISQKDVDQAARPYSIKEGKIVGLGGKGTAVDAGTWKGNYESWLNQLTPSQKKDFLGPRRLELIESGHITFNDLVDTKTGRLRLINELKPSN